MYIQKNEKQMVKTEHVGLGLRGISKEQLEKGDKVIVKNANMYGM